MRLIVRRVRPTPGSRLALFCDYDYHGFVTDREGETLALEADHRRHAEVENVIRDLKYGVGLNHLPSGKFAANAAWLTLNVLAHNLARWTSRIGLGETLITTKTLRVRYLDLPGRLTRSARRWHLHLPTRWPWASRFLLALDRLRCVPFPPDRPHHRRPTSPPMVRGSLPTRRLQRPSVPAAAPRTPEHQERIAACAPPGPTHTSDPLKSRRQKRTRWIPA
jgi:hypothetical protein